MIQNIESEIWEDITDWEGEYQISNMGRVKSLERIVIYSDGRRYVVKEKLLKQVTDDNGYLRVVFSRNQKLAQFQVHRLVALAFIDNPENKRTVNHKFGNVLDNRASELEWATHSEQQEHAYRVLGRVKNMKGRTGDRHPAFGIRGEAHHAFGKPGYSKGIENIARMRKVRCDTLDITFKSLGDACKTLDLSTTYMRLILTGKKRHLHGLDLRYA